MISTVPSTEEIHEKWGNKGPHAGPDGHDSDENSNHDWFTSIRPEVLIESVFADGGDIG